MCTCGSTESHTIARRQTADGVTITLWHDGAITGWYGRALPGVPIARPRSPAALDVSLRAGWMLADEVTLYDADEVPALYAACRWAAVRGLDRGGMLARLVDQAQPSVRPVWTVLAADRDGRPTERAWQLSRLRWPGGLAVFDSCSGAARYHVFHRIAADTYVPTGIRFSTLTELAVYLDAEARLN